MKSIAYRLLVACLAISINLFLPSKSAAQSGNVSSYKPSASAYQVCAGTSVTIYATGLPIARWIYRDNNVGPWLLLSTTSSDNISQFMTAGVTTTRTFRAVVSTPSCVADTTSGVDVVIEPPAYGTDLSIKLSASNYTVCSGGSVALNMMNEDKRLENWLFRDNNGLWQTLAFTTNQSLNVNMPFVSVPLTRQFRVLVRNGCTLDSSDILSVIVNPTINGYNNTIKPILNTSNEICAGTTAILSADWAFSYGSWIFRDSITGNWGTLSSGGSNGFDFNTNVTQLTSREYRVLLRNDITCSNDTSAASKLCMRPSSI